MLTTANGASEYWGNSYGYEAWGNLSQKTVTECSAENLSVAALANNQLSGYGYDAAGNMIHDATPGNNYSYDQENRITGAAGYTYTYDADGNRVEKSNGSAGTIYWSMSPGIVAESDLTGTLTAEYLFFNDQRIARRDRPSGSVSYYFSGHLGTADVITDSAGNIKYDADHYPWGGELPFVNNDPNKYKFGGHEQDGETGLYYYGARHYHSALSRFMTPDWEALPGPVAWADFENPQSLNRYSYVLNNPLSLADPDGHDCVVQSSTGANTEKVTVSSGNCDNVKVGDGQTKTFVDGTVDSITRGADGKSIDIGYTNHDTGAAGVTNANFAPYPDNPGTAYNFGNNAQGYATLNQAGKTVNAIGIATGVVVGANAAMMLAGPAADFLAKQAYERALQAWNAYKGTGQARLLAQYFKTGVRPPGLTPQAVAAYLALAKAYIAAGKGFVEGMAVQSQRIQQLENLVKSMWK
jgi:RHS repeat-associated protein